MGAMMLDVVKSCAQTFFRDTKRPRELILEVSHSRSIAEPVLDLLKTRARGGIQDLLVQVGRRIARDTNMVQIFQGNPRRIETVTYRLRRKSSRMFAAIEAFFLSRSDQMSIFNKGRRRIPVVPIYAKNV